MTIRVVTAPTREPVTLEEARIWARVDPDDTSQDAMLLLLIRTAREWAENYTGRSFVNRTLELRLPHFTFWIELPRPPLVSVSTVSYLDTDGVWQTLGGSPDEFQVEAYREPARIRPLRLESWPSTQTDTLDPVRVTYVAGYGVETKNMPAALRVWMQGHVATLDAFREHVIVGNARPIDYQFAVGLLDSLLIPGAWFR